LLLFLSLSGHGRAPVRRSFVFFSVALREGNLAGLVLRCIGQSDPAHLFFFDNLLLF
jgi:hypothetical protein